MDALSTIELLNDLEQRYPVAAWTVAGLPVWPLVRTSVSWTTNASFVQQRQDLQADDNLRRRTRQLSERPRQWARAGALALRPGRAPKVAPGAEVLFLGDSVSRVELDGCWYDRLCDPLADLLERSGTTTAHMEPWHVYRLPTFRPTRRVAVAVDGLWMASRVAPRPAAHLPGFDKFVRRLIQEVGHDGGLGGRGLLLQGSYQNLLARYFGRVLRRVRPRAAFVVDLGVVQMGFHHAARRLNIPSIEVQHGTITERSAHYASWANVPPHGYSTLPSHYWVWSELEAGVIDAWRGRDVQLHRPVVGGNLWLRRWVVDRDALVLGWEQAARALLHPVRHPSLNVLVTLGTGQTGAEQLAPVQAAIASLPTHWRWWIRGHPTMSSAELAGAAERLAGPDNVLVDGVERLPLYALLRAADVHVTYNSSTIIEAPYFGVQSIATEPGVGQAYCAQRQAGWLTEVESGEDLVWTLRYEAERPKRPPQPWGLATDPKELLAELVAPLDPLDAG